MKIPETRLYKSPYQSCIFHHEKKQFSSWHQHPEYELVLITRGAGLRMIGDNIDRFKKSDLIFLGPYLPHEWRCDEKYFGQSGTFLGEGIVIQFSQDSFGKQFLELPENSYLKSFFSKARQGCQIFGTSRDNIISVMNKMITMESTERLYALFSIFNYFSDLKEFRLLSSPAFMGSFKANAKEPIQKAVQYILQNFQKQVKISDLLEISNMSSTTFFNSFKKMYRMTFKRYLLNIRIGYACRLLGEETMNISEIAYECGFENLSNFNRQFRVIKNCSPREYKWQLRGKS